MKSKFSVKKYAVVEMKNIIGDYTNPEDVPEWAWVEEQAEHICKDNGQLDMWDFTISIPSIDYDLRSVPASLQELFKQLIKEEIKLVHFIQ